MYIVLIAPLQMFVVLHLPRPLLLLEFFGVLIRRDPRSTNMTSQRLITPIECIFLRHGQLSELLL